MQFPRLAGALIAAVFLLIPARAQTIDVKIIAFNDFHGNLQSPGTGRANAQSPAVPAGGADALAAYVARLKSESPYNTVVAAGDLVGASPLISSLFNDEPMIEAMNSLGLELTSVGNHEFDKGKHELLRKQHGGCSTQNQNTCQSSTTTTPVPFAGAKFQYLAANVTDLATGKTLFPAYAIKTYHGVKIAFIGLTLKDTPTIVVPTAVAGLRFDDEATTINALVRQLRPQGVRSFIVLIHQGGGQTTKGPPDINACEGNLNGTDIQPIVNHLDNAVSLVISAHTHQAYICQLPNSTGRLIPVTSAASYGRLLTDIDLTVNTRTRRVTAVKAHNLVVDRTAITPVPAITALTAHYSALAAPILNRPIGSITADITRKPGPGGQSALGELLADAQLAATHSPSTGAADIAFVNNGGVRADLPFTPATPGLPNGAVTYGALFTIQPFANTLVTLTLTGEQIKTLLEEQVRGCALGGTPTDPVPTGDRTLQVSAGFHYTLNKSGPTCAKIDPATLTLNGAPILPTSTYRVTVNNFLADGGDQFYILKSGTNRLPGPVDVEATIAWFTTHPTLTPTLDARVTIVP